jgi:hypothetical protein
MKDFVWAAVGITSYTVENTRKKEAFHARKVPESIWQMLLEGGAGWILQKI